jgi:hypothetical protein
VTLSKAASTPADTVTGKKSLGSFPLLPVLVGALLVVGVIAAVWSANHYRKAADAAMAPSAEKRERSDADAKRHDSIRRAMLGSIMLHDAQLHTDGYGVDRAMLMDDGTVCYSYHTQNPSGGTDAKTAVLLPDSQVLKADVGSEQTSWAKSCAQQTGMDVTARVRLQ